MITFKIGTGEFQIVATTTRSADFKNIYLEEAEGWDDFPEQDRKSVEKMAGDGDFVSKFVRRKSKDLQIILAAIDTVSSVRDVREKVAYWEGSNELITLELTRTDGYDTIVEVFENCRINSRTLWKQKGDGFARINMSFKTAGPYKKVSKNGAPFVDAL